MQSAASIFLSVCPFVFHSYLFNQVTFDLDLWVITLTGQGHRSGSEVKTRLVLTGVRAFLVYLVHWPHP